MQQESKIIDCDATLLAWLMKIKEKTARITYRKPEEISWREATKILAGLMEVEEIVI